jgi:hypothetical protein
VSGRIEAWTVNGLIRLIGGRSNDIRAETVGGDIVYAGRVATGGTYDFESHSGAVRLTIPGSSGAQFRLETVSGTVQSDFPIAAAPAAGVRNGRRVEFAIGDGKAQVTARTFSGRILIKSDAGSSVQRESGSIVRIDSVPRARRDSASNIRRDSLPPTPRDSVQPARRDSAPPARKDSVSTTR